MVVHRLGTALQAHQEQGAMASHVALVVYAVQFTAGEMEGDGEVPEEEPDPEPEPVVERRSAAKSWAMMSPAHSTGASARGTQDRPHLPPFKRTHTHTQRNTHTLGHSVTSIHTRAHTRITEREAPGHAQGTQAPVTNS